MGMTLDEAAAVMREAMRETVRKYSVWYLLQGGLMVVAGVLALLYPFFASTAIVVLLGWLLIFAGVVQGIGLIGAGNVPHYWLQLISVVLAIVIGTPSAPAARKRASAHDRSLDRVLYCFGGDPTLLRRWYHVGTSH